MAKKVHGVDQSGKAPGPPLVGALLRRPFMEARGHIIEQLHEAGFTDVQAAHLAVFQYPGPEGRTPGDIARAAGSSKQAMNNLLANLEQTGYLRRQVNPANRRERVVELTPRGQATIKAIRAAVLDIEARWRSELGVERYEELRSLLEELNQTLEGRPE